MSLTMVPLTVGSLFSGIGGLELGLERAGMRVVWQVEKDEYCRRVLAKHWPDVERFEDVREVGAHNLKPVDLICGGFPCQDISAAGKRVGITGARSGLWSEYARIVREIRPRYVLVENVSALLVRGLDRVLGELAESGYDAEWFVLAASDVGAPHLRERVFVVAHPEGVNGPRRRFAGPDKRDAKRDAKVPKGRTHDGQPAVPDATRERHHDGRRLERSEESARARCAHQWSIEPDVGRVAHGVPRRVDRLRALGNAVVPQVAELIGHWIVEADKEMRGAA